MKPSSEAFIERLEEFDSLLNLEYETLELIENYGSLDEFVCNYSLDLNNKSLIFKVKYAATKEQALLDSDRYPNTLIAKYSESDYRISKEKFLNRVTDLLDEVTRNAVLSLMLQVDKEAESLFNQAFSNQFTPMYKHEGAYGNLRNQTVYILIDIDNNVLKCYRQNKSLFTYKFERKYLENLYSEYIKN